jgi:hypothetical protein
MLQTSHKYLISIISFFLDIAGGGGETFQGEGATQVTEAHDVGV